MPILLGIEQEQERTRTRREGKEEKEVLLRLLKTTRTSEWLLRTTAITITALSIILKEDKQKSMMNIINKTKNKSTHTHTQTNTPITTNNTKKRKDRNYECYWDRQDSLDFFPKNQQYGKHKSNVVIIFVELAG